MVTLLQWLKITAVEVKLSLKVSLLWGSSGACWINDPESYAGSSVATGRASHATQIEVDDPDKKGYPGPPSWRLGVGLKTPPHKNVFCWEASKIEDEAKVHQGW